VPDTLKRERKAVERQNTSVVDSNGSRGDILEGEPSRNIDNRSQEKGGERSLQSCG